MRDRIIEALRGHGPGEGPTAEELAEKLGVSLQKVSYHLKELYKENLADKVETSFRHFVWYLK